MVREGVMDEWKVRILHISDLHERGPREPEPFRRRRVLGDAWKRNLDALLEDGAIDLVCFTGDVADWGKATEYGPATDFIEALRQQLSLPVERLFLVPGNHDIDRTKGLNAWADLRGGKDAAGQERKGKLFRVRPLELSRWMAGGAPPLGLENVSREELLSRQEAYREWVSTQLRRPELLPSKETPHPFLGYRQTLRLPGQPFDIHIVGLDSAWLAGDDNDSGKLLLTTNQVGQLTTHGGEPLLGFRLALIHHPLSDLADKDDSQRMLADRVDLLLRGHLHNEALETWKDPDRTSRQLAAGCLYEGHEGDEWPNACHVIEACLDKEGRPVRYNLRFRSWAKRGHWHNDNSIYEGTQDGRLSWKIRPSPLPSPAPRTGSFVGRERELEKLRAALWPSERRPVAICSVHGMPGVGKSYLAARFAELYADHFPGGCVRIVLNPAALPSVDVLLGELCTQLEVPAGAQLAENCRERLLRPLSLLVLENVDSRDAADLTVRFAGLLQGCPLLVTGRFQGFSEAGGWTRIEVETLEKTAALQLLEQEVRPAVDEHEKERYRHLARTLGHLPLALHLAAGYLRAGHSAEGFLEHLREQGFNLEPVFRNDALFSENKARSIIRSTFELSLELLRNQFGASAKAERLLAGLAALGHGPLSGFGRSLGTAIAGITELEFGELVAAASLLSLLSRVPNKERKDDAWRVHPLLAELLRESGDAPHGLNRMTDWFITRLPELEPSQTHLQGAHWKEIHREGNALVDWLLQIPLKDRIRAGSAGVRFAATQGPFPAWANFYREALQGSLTTEERSEFLYALAYVSMMAGALDQALPAAQEQEALGKENNAPRVVTLAAGVRADILRSQGKTDESLLVLRNEVLPVLERLGDERSRAVNLGKIADILQFRGDLEDALRIRKEEELPVYKRLDDVYGHAVTLAKIADILELRGKHDEALSILQKDVLPTFERIGDLRSRTVALGKIADVFHSKGMLDESLRIRRDEELPVYERLGDVRERAVTLGKIADILHSRRDFSEALRIRREEELPLYKHLRDLRERSLTLERIAYTLHVMGESSEALRIYEEEVLPILEHLNEARLIVRPLFNMAGILRSQGRTEDAIYIFREQLLPACERLGSMREREALKKLITNILISLGSTES